MGEHLGHLGDEEHNQQHMDELESEFSNVPVKGSDECLNCPHRAGEHSPTVPRWIKDYSKEEQDKHFYPGNHQWEGNEDPQHCRLCQRVPSVSYENPGDFTYGENGCGWISCGCRRFTLKTPMDRAHEEVENADKTRRLLDIFYEHGQPYGTEDVGGDEKTATIDDGKFDTATCTDCGKELMWDPDSDAWADEDDSILCGGKNEPHTPDPHTLKTSRLSHETNEPHVHEFSEEQELEGLKKDDPNRVHVPEDANDLKPGAMYDRDDLAAIFDLHDGLWGCGGGYDGPNGGIVVGPKEHELTPDLDCPNCVAAMKDQHRQMSHGRFGQPTYPGRCPDCPPSHEGKLSHETDEPHMHDPFNDAELNGLVLHPVNEGEGPKEYTRRTWAEHKENHGNWDFDPQCLGCRVMRNDHGNGHPAYFADPAIENPDDRLKKRDCYWCTKDYQDRRDEAPWYKRPFVSHTGPDAVAHHTNSDQLLEQHPYWTQCGTCGGDGVAIGSTDVESGEQKQKPCTECGGIGEAYDAEYWDSDDQLHDFANYPSFRDLKIPDKSLKQHMKDKHGYEKGEDSYTDHQAYHGKGAPVEGPLADILLKTGDYNPNIGNIEEEIASYAAHAGLSDGEGAPYDSASLAEIYAPRVRQLIDLKNQGYETAEWKGCEGCANHKTFQNHWHGYGVPTKLAVNRTRSWYLKQRDDLVDRIGQPDKSTTVHDFGDGWTIKHLQTVGDARYEGGLMKNCIKDIGKNPCWDCNADDESNDEWRGRCPECEGEDSNGCGACDGSGKCGSCGGSGYHPDGASTPIGHSLMNENEEHPWVDDDYHGRIYSLRDPDNIPHVSFTMTDQADSEGGLYSPLGDEEGINLSNLYGKTNKPPKKEDGLKVAQFFKDYTKDKPGTHTVDAQTQDDRDQAVRDGGFAAGDGVSPDEAIHVFGGHDGTDTPWTAKLNCGLCKENHENGHNPENAKFCETHKIGWQRGTDHCRGVGRYYQSNPCHSKPVPEENKHTDLNCPECMQPRLFAASAGDTTDPTRVTQTPNFIPPTPRGKDPWKDVGDSGLPEHNPALQHDPKLKRMIMDQQFVGPTQANVNGWANVAHEMMLPHVHDNDGFHFDEDFRYDPVVAEAIHGAHLRNGDAKSPICGWCDALDSIEKKGQTWTQSDGSEWAPKAGPVGNPRGKYDPWKDKADTGELILPVPSGEDVKKWQQGPRRKPSTEQSVNAPQDTMKMEQVVGGMMTWLNPPDPKDHEFEAGKIIEGKPLKCKVCGQISAAHGPEDIVRVAGAEKTAMALLNEDEVPPALADTIREFKKLPNVHRLENPGTAAMRCGPASYDFADFARSRGHKADVRLLRDAGWQKAFKNNPQREHDEYQGSRHAVPFVDGHYVDWTARQYNADSPVPRIYKNLKDDDAIGAEGIPFRQYFRGNRHDEGYYDLMQFRPDAKEWDPAYRNPRTVTCNKHKDDWSNSCAVFPGKRHINLANCTCFTTPDGEEDLDSEGMFKFNPPFTVKPGCPIHGGEEATNAWFANKKVAAVGWGWVGEFDAAAAMKRCPDCRYIGKTGPFQEKCPECGGTLELVDDKKKTATQEPQEWDLPKLLAHLSDEHDFLPDLDEELNGRPYQDMLEDTHSTMHVLEPNAWNHRHAQRRTAGTEVDHRYHDEPDLDCSKCMQEIFATRPNFLRPPPIPYQGPKGPRGRTALFDYDPVRDVQTTERSAPAPSAQGSGGDPWPDQGDNGTAPPRPGWIRDPKLKKWVRDEQLTYPDVGPTFPGVTDVNQIAAGRSSADDVGAYNWVRWIEEVGEDRYIVTAAACPKHKREKSTELPEFSAIRTHGVKQCYFCGKSDLVNRVKAQAVPQQPADYDADNGIDGPLDRPKSWPRGRKLIQDGQVVAPDNGEWNVSVDNQTKTGSTVDTYNELKKHAAAGRDIHVTYDPKGDGNERTVKGTVSAMDWHHDGAGGAFSFMTKNDEGVYDGELQIPYHHVRGIATTEKTGQAQPDSEQTQQPAPKLTDLQMHVIDQHPRVVEEYGAALAEVPDGELEEAHIMDHATGWNTHNPEVLKVARDSNARD